MKNSSSKTLKRSEKGKKGDDDIHWDSSLKEDMADRPFTAIPTDETLSGSSNSINPLEITPKDRGLPLIQVDVLEVCLGEEGFSQHPGKSKQNPIETFFFFF